MIHPDWLDDVRRLGVAAAVCTVIATKGSTPRKAGASMLVIDDDTPQGAIRGTIGGGAVEHEIRRRALEVIASTRPALVEIPLTTVLGMCCGGTMTIFIESLRLRPPCVLFGAGHVGEALCRAAQLAGFDVTVVDPRDELCSPERFPDATLKNSYDHDDDLDALPFSADAFVVIATHDHQVDQRLAERVLSRPARYVGLVGSQRKAALTRERCRNKGLSDDDIARLRCPAGLDIGAETPEEIALSIVAQMVQVRRRDEASERRTRGAEIEPVDGGGVEKAG
jgi:xanthine dehydrogenase accessory factor